MRTHLESRCIGRPDSNLFLLLVLVHARHKRGVHETHLAFESPASVGAQRMWSACIRASGPATQRADSPHLAIHSEDAGADLLNVAAHLGHGLTDVA